MADKHPPVSALTEDQVVWGYRMFLDREPEDRAAVEEKLRSIPSVQALRRALLTSEEYLAMSPYSVAGVTSGTRRRMDVQVDAPAEVQAKILEHTAEVWQGLGATEPYWSVLTDESFRMGSIEGNLGVFEESGRAEVEAHLSFLDSNAVDVTRLESVIEYGCGVGRVTRWLAERFKTVYAYDVSASHLRQARAYLKSSGSTNVFTNHLRNVPAQGELPGTDLVYCFLVLQHNPPPIIAQTLRRLLEAVAPGGYALFQVPTYRNGYAFDLDAYMTSVAIPSSTGAGFEMHVLPQRRVHSIIAESGCLTLEVLQDDAAGEDYVSNTFLVGRT